MTADGGDTALDRREGRATESRAAKARTEAARQRNAFLSELARRKLPKADVAALVLDQFIASARRDPVRLASQLLGVAPVAGPYGDDWHATLRSHASTGPGQRDRAALALALAIGEEESRQSHISVDRSPVAGRHFAFLLTFGYEPTEADGLPAGWPPVGPDEEGLAESTQAD